MYSIHRKQVIIGHERVVPSNLLTASPKKKKKKEIHAKKYSSQKHSSVWLHFTSPEKTVNK